MCHCHNYWAWVLSDSKITQCIKWSNLLYWHLQNKACNTLTCTQNLVQILWEAKVRYLLILSVVVNTSHFYKRELSFLGFLMDIYSFRPDSFAQNSVLLYTSTGFYTMLLDFFWSGFPLCGILGNEVLFWILL